MKRSTLLLALSLAAPAAFAENLLDVYRLAQTNDPAWARALAAHQANIEKGPQGRALLLPSVLFNASAAKLNQDSKTAIIDGSFRYRSDTYNVQITQPLYRKQNFAAYAQGLSGVSQAEAELAIARQDLILRAGGAYFDVLAAHDTLDYSTDEKQAIARQLALATRNYNVGTKTLVDVHEAQARLDQAHAQEIVADIDLHSKQEALIQITRGAPAALATLTARLPLENPEPADPENGQRRPRPKTRRSRSRNRRSKSPFRKSRKTAAAITRRSIWSPVAVTATLAAACSARRSNRPPIRSRCKCRCRCFRAAASPPRCANRWRAATRRARVWNRPDAR